MTEEDQAKSQHGGGEPSMDDILASIRRILSEDAGAEKHEPARSPAPAGVNATQQDWEPAATWRDVEADPPSAASDAGLEAADDDASDEASDELLLLTPEMRAAPVSTLKPRRVVSPVAAEAATDVLAQLARAILDRRDIAVGARDVTLESMVREMLRPLLREWLDRNLPYLIERLVKKEIDLMVNRAERLD